MRVRRSEARGDDHPAVDDALFVSHLLDVRLRFASTRARSLRGKIGQNRLWSRCGRTRGCCLERRVFSSLQRRDRDPLAAASVALYFARNAEVTHQSNMAAEQVRLSPRDARPRDRAAPDGPGSRRDDGKNPKRAGSIKETTPRARSAVAAGR